MKLERPTADRAAPLGAMVGAWLAAAGALAAVWLRLGLPRPVCQLKHWTGLPCPTCGSTRLVESMLRGDFLEAASWNPLLFGALIGAIVWAGVSTSRAVLGWPRRRLVLERREWLALGVVTAVAMAAGWAYLILRGV